MDCVTAICKSRRRAISSDVCLRSGRRAVRCGATRCDARSTAPQAPPSSESCAYPSLLVRCRVLAVSQLDGLVGELSKSGDWQVFLVLLLLRQQLIRLPNRIHHQPRLHSKKASAFDASFAHLSDCREDVRLSVVVAVGSDAEVDLDRRRVSLEPVRHSDNRVGRAAQSRPMHVSMLACHARSMARPRLETRLSAQSCGARLRARNGASAKRRAGRLTDPCGTADQRLAADILA